MLQSEILERRAEVTPHPTGPFNLGSVWIRNRFSKIELLAEVWEDVLALARAYGCPRAVAAFASEGASIDVPTAREIGTTLRAALRDRVCTDNTLLSGKKGRVQLGAIADFLRQGSCVVTYRPKGH